jgi:membrane-bound inhibitor of C-type lysozyme
VWRRGLILMAAVWLMGSAMPGQAQTFVSYACADGTPVMAAFFPGEKRVHIQVDGKSRSLPQRIAASGARYAKGGVSLWTKGQEAWLKRPKKKVTLCKAQ